MTSAASAQAVAQALARVMAQDKGRLLSALAYRLRDISLAEDMLQEASISALKHWGRAGIPNSPQGWLLRVALRRAIDKIRAAGRAAKGQADLAMLAEEEAGDTSPEAIPDARLRMMFTCCHPALEAKSQVALTLRVICGLTTAQIAAVFLDNDVTIGQRISRAKAKITAAGIGFSIPDAAAWPARLQSVLTAVYLIFTRGYAAGPGTGQDLCQEALFLARLLVHLAPSDPEIEGLLALILITHARAAARAQGALIADQDRSLWNSAMLAEGLDLVTTALARGQVGPFQIKAAIAACHVRGSGPDWPQIAALIATLLRFEDTPVVRLSHAVALGEVQGAQAALALMTALEDALADYGPFHAARAEFLARLGSGLAAQGAYARAMDLAETLQDRAVLAQRQTDMIK
jgi:RNA polymerase sigma-70 factor (ECF subfamily)